MVGNKKYLSIGISNHLFPQARLYGRSDSPTSGQSDGNCGKFSDNSPLAMPI